MLKLKKLFCDQLGDAVTLVSGENSSPYVVSFSVPGIKAEIMQRVLDDNGVLVSTGSACSSKIGTSRIITACGLEKRVAEGVLRASFIYNTSENDVLNATRIIKECIQRLRKNLK